MAEPALAVALALSAPAGSVTFTPAASIDTASIRARTPAGCPGQADSYHAVARGHGFPAGGQLVSTPTGAGMSRTEGFDVYFAQTMKDFAADNGSTLTGRYDIAVYCTNGFTGEVFAEFTGALTFTSLTTYTSGAVPPEVSSALVAAAPAARSLSSGWIAAAIAAIAALALAFESGRRFGRRSA